MSNSNNNSSDGIGVAALVIVAIYGMIIVLKNQKIADD